MDNKTPYDAGYAGKDCPEPPADLEWWDVEFWVKAYETGKVDKAADLARENQASPACPEDGTLLRKTEDGLECKFHPKRERTG